MLKKVRKTDAYSSLLFTTFLEKAEILNRVIGSTAANKKYLISIFIFITAQQKNIFPNSNCAHALRALGIFKSSTFQGALSIPFHYM